MPDQHTAAAPDAVAEIHEFMDRVREYGYACRFPLTNGGPATEKWNLDIIESAITAIVARCNRLEVENAAKALVVGAALQWEIDALSSWEGDESITDNWAHAPLMAAVLAFRTDAATAPPDDNKENHDGQ